MGHVNIVAKIVAVGAATFPEGYNSLLHFLPGHQPCLLFFLPRLLWSLGFPEYTSRLYSQMPIFSLGSVPKQVTFFREVPYPSLNGKSPFL